MKADLVIETIKSIKNEACEHQMYELAASLRTTERELGSQYTFDDEVEVDHFVVLLQTCLAGLPDDQKLFLISIVRELKLSQIL
jgi:hypothetical protein